MDGDTVMVADFNRDGTPDIATADCDVVIRSGRGDGTFGERVKAYASRCVIVMRGGAVADFDGDGRTDLASSAVCDIELPECEGNTAYVFLNWTGRAAPPCVVPNVLAYDLDTARRIVRRAGCRLGHIHRRPSRQAQSSAVRGVRPEEGTVLPSGSAVDLIMSVPRRP